MHRHVSRLWEFEVPKEMAKPFLGTKPFRMYQLPTLDRFCATFLDHPYRRGVLSDYYRSIFQISYPPLLKFVRFEAHLNLTTTHEGDEDILLDYGFEPDDFDELYPNIYQRNFTYSFDLDHTEYRRQIGLNEFTARCKDAQRYVQSRTEVDGFLEAEIIPSINFFNPIVTRKVLSEPIPTPFDARCYRAMSLAEFVDEPNKLHVGTRKKSDIHIKFFGRLLPSSLLGSRISNRSEFAKFLEDSAFYRITSVSGNTIYTGQFINGEIAQDMYSRLRVFIEVSGLADSIVIEPCVSFWRKTTISEGAIKYAKVSPIVVPAEPRPQ